jgi:hypothetical protein
MDANLLRRLAHKIPIRLQILVGNLWAPFRGAGIKVTRVTSDFRYFEVMMRLRWFNRNYVGTHFGGSLYAMTDPFYMMMLMNNLGRDYIVWDKGAKIEFKKPGRGTVTARFHFSEAEIAAVKAAADDHQKYLFDKSVDVVDESGEVVASVVKTLYVRRRNARPPVRQD